MKSGRPYFIGFKSGYQIRPPYEGEFSRLFRLWRQQPTHGRLEYFVRVGPGEHQIPH